MSLCVKIYHGRFQDTTAPDNGVKKMRFDPDIPLWETSLDFNPCSQPEAIRDLKWVNIHGETAQPPTCVVTAEDASKGKDFCLEELSFRDPNHFIAGHLHDYEEEWKKIDTPDLVLNWINNGVDIVPMFKHFKGNFKGKSFDCDFPPPAYFPNAKNCRDYSDFIAETFLDRIRNGSVSVIGRVGVCDPPYLVLPLTVEPSKPRLCHDERYLNLWVQDNPFVLDTLKDVPRFVERNSYMVSLDDKSGYDHIFLEPSCRKYFGIQFAGWFFVFNTIPFGFKASAFIYHTTGLVPISHCAKLGVPCLLYIDDRMLSEWLKKTVWC